MRRSLLEEGQWQALNGLKSSSPSRQVWWIKKTGASQAINGCLLLFRFPIEVINASAGSGGESTHSVFSLSSSQPHTSVIEVLLCHQSVSACVQNSLFLRGEEDICENVVRENALLESGKY